MVMAESNTSVPEISKMDDQGLVAYYLSENEKSSSVNQNNGAWFIICFFGMMVSVVVYHWWRLLKEASDEEETNVKLGSFYEALAAKKALACRRNAIQYDENLIVIS